MIGRCSQEIEPGECVLWAKARGVGEGNGEKAVGDVVRIDVRIDCRMDGRQPRQGAIVCFAVCFDVWYRASEHEKATFFVQSDDVIHFCVAAMMYSPRALPIYYICVVL